MGLFDIVEEAINVGSAINDYRNQRLNNNTGANNMRFNDIPNNTQTSMPSQSQGKSNIKLEASEIINHSKSEPNCENSNNLRSELAKYFYKYLISECGFAPECIGCIINESDDIIAYKEPANNNSEGESTNFQKYYTVAFMFMLNRDEVFVNISAKVESINKDRDLEVINYLNQSSLNCMHTKCYLNFENKTWYAESKVCYKNFEEGKRDLVNTATAGTGLLSFAFNTTSAQEIKEFEKSMNHS